MDTNTRIYIANLGKYNEGELVGEWIDLPATEEELNELYARIKVAHFNEEGEIEWGYEEDGILYEETAIHDYETDIDGLIIGEWDRVSELNELVLNCEELDEWDYKKLLAIVEVESCDLEDAFEYLDVRTLYEGIDNEEDLGRFFYDNGRIEIPEYLINYFDFEAYGRDTAEDGNFTSYGFLTRYQRKAPARVLF